MEQVLPYEIRVRGSDGTIVIIGGTNNVGYSGQYINIMIELDSFHRGDVGHQDPPDLSAD